MYQIQKFFRKTGKALQRFFRRVRKGSPLDLSLIHILGALRAKDAGTEMTVAGSIAKCRDKGGIIFADLRDNTGILQLIFDDSTDKAVFEKAGSLKSEYVVIAKGVLRERDAKTDKIPTGEVELFVTELRVLSEAETTPFEVRDGINVNDQLLSLIHI